MQLALVLLTVVGTVTGSAPFPYGEWTALLARNVDGNGRVDYAAVDRAAFERVFAAVAASSPKSKPALYPSKAAREAYYLDAYNVLVWKSVLARLPGLTNVDAVSDAFFRGTRFSVGGDELSLTDLENRLRAELKNPRVHFALNCASLGCPRLPREAFTPDKLDAQLERETRRFCNERRNVDFDAAGKRLRLSHIFDWYKADFGGDPAAVIGFINRYRDGNAKLPVDAKVEYVDYDWSLNVQ